MTTPSKRGFPHDPQVYCLDTTTKCVVCGAPPNGHLEILAISPGKRTTLDFSHAPVCSDACANKQYLDTLNQGFCGDATKLYKKITLCSKTHVSPAE